MKFERLDPKKHHRKTFDYGVIALNDNLQQFANQDQKRGLARVYVLAEQQQIIGYYSIRAHSMSTDQLPDNSKLGGYTDAPFLLLGRLAVDRHYQGQGYDDTLIFHAFKITSEAAEKIGTLGMIVDAKDEVCVRFDRLCVVRVAVIHGAASERDISLIEFVKMKMIDKLVPLLIPLLDVNF